MDITDMLPSNSDHQERLRARPRIIGIKSETADRILRFEGWIMVVLLSILGALGNYTLGNISDNFKEMLGQVKQIQSTVSDLNARVGVMSEDIANVKERIQRDENHGNPRGQ